jgi:2'-5' RNA ligase
MPRATWVAAKAVHLTLKFLGDVPVARAMALGESLRSLPVIAIAGCRTAGARAFPSDRRARVLVLELTCDDGALGALADDVEARTDSLGFTPRDRAFVPHVTLARLKAPSDVRRCLKDGVPELACRPTALVLYKSELLPEGPEHTPIVTVPLHAR